MTMRLPCPPAPYEVATRTTVHPGIGRHGIARTRSLAEFPLGYVGRHRAFDGDDDATVAFHRVLPESHDQAAEHARVVPRMFTELETDTTCGASLVSAHMLGDACTRPAGHYGLHGETDTTPDPELLHRAGQQGVVL